MSSSEIGTHWLNFHEKNLKDGENKWDKMFVPIKTFQKEI